MSGRARRPRPRTSGIRRDRRGYTLAEALVALLVAGILIVGLAGVLALVGRVALRLTQTAAAAETERVVPAVLGAELAALTAVDVAFGGDSVRLRAFRAGGVVCSLDGSELALEYGGVRRPEEEKDSVLLVWDDGEAAFEIESVLTGGCAGTESVRLHLVRPPQSDAPPLFALIYESGTYSIAASAFRYRRGHAGRQPLTAENLTPASALDGWMAHDDVLVAGIVLYPTHAQGSIAFEWRRRLSQGRAYPAVHAP